MKKYRVIEIEPGWFEIQIQKSYLLCRYWEQVLWQKFASSQIAEMELENYLLKQNFKPRVTKEIEI